MSPKDWLFLFFVVLVIFGVMFGYPLIAMLRRFGAGRRFRP